LEYSTIKMEINIKEVGLKIKEMVKELYGSQMEKIN
jgi:hypothetical protein